jgi:hypothetical protein
VPPVKRIAAIPLLLSLICCGCGYRHWDESRVFGDEVRHIEIRMFENRSSEPGLERMLADALQEEFARRGALRPTWKSGSGELVLQGMIRDVQVNAVALSSVGMTLEEQISVRLDVSVLRSSDTEPVYGRRGLQVSERFTPSSDPQVYQTSKEEALRRITAEVAARIHDELFQTF